MSSAIKKASSRFNKWAQKLGRNSYETAVKRLEQGVPESKIMAELSGAPDIPRPSRVNRPSPYETPLLLDDDFGKGSLKYQPTPMTEVQGPPEMFGPPKPKKADTRDVPSLRDDYADMDAGLLGPYDRDVVGRKLPQMSRRAAMGAGAAALGGAGLLGGFGLTADDEAGTEAATTTDTTAGSGEGDSTDRRGPPPEDDMTLEHTPIDTSEFEKRFKANTAALINAESDFDEDAKQLDQDMSEEIARSRALYAGAKDEVASKEMWESIIQGIAHMAAGVIGHQTGLDLGGLQFDKKNWEAERDRLYREMQARNAEAEKRMNSQQRALSDRRTARYRRKVMDDEVVQRAMQTHLENEKDKRRIRDIKYSEAEKLKRAKTVAGAERDKSAARAASDAYKSAKREADRMIKAWQKGDVDWEDAKSALQVMNSKATTRTQQFNIPESEPRELFGFRFGESEPEYKDLMEAQLNPPTPIRGKVRMQAPGGQTGLVAPSEVERLESLGYKRI